MKLLNWQRVLIALVFFLAGQSAASRVGDEKPLVAIRGATAKRPLALLSVGEEPEEHKEGDGHGEGEHKEGDGHGEGEHKEEEGHGDGHGEGHGHDEHKEEHEGEGGHEKAEEHGHDDIGKLEHGAEEEEHGHGEKTAHGVAVLLLASVILLPSIFMLVTSENRLIRSNTLRLIDNFVSIFLAVMWFQAFDEFLKINNFSSTHKFIGAIIHVLILFVLVNVLANVLRGQQVSLLVFTTIGAHYLSFAAIHASEHSQEHYFDGSVAMAFAFAPVVLVILCSMMAIMYVFRMYMKWTENEKLEEAVEDMEIDVCALTLAFIITQAVRYTLIGKYPGDAGEAHEVNHGEGDGGGEGHHLFLQHVGNHHGHGHGVSHNAWHRNFMMGYTLVCLLVASFLPWGMFKKAVHGNPHLTRAVMIAHHTMVMLGAWGFMLWGEWEFFETIFVGDTHEVFGRIVFAILCTIVAIVIVLLMAFLGDSICPYHVSTVFALALGLSCAWSWEHAFDVSVEAVAEAYHFIPGKDNDAKVLKGCTALIAPCFMIPPYIKYIKPQVMKEEEEAEEDEE